MNKTRFSILLAAFTLIIGCKAKEQSEDETPSYSSQYQVVEVKNGATITGAVVWHAESLPAKAIEIQKDQDACGLSHPNPSDYGIGEGMKGVLIYLEDIHSGKAFGSDIATHGTLDQKGCEFLPHIQLVKQGSELLVSNSDKALHNSNFKLNGVSLSNFAQPDGTPPRPVTLDKPGIYNVTCDVHAWMRGFVIVPANPYYAITGSDGKFEISNVPAGTYTLKLWRDNWALSQPKDAEGRITAYTWAKDFEKEQKVTLTAGQSLTVDFAMPGDMSSGK
jgi:plastocyanin